VLIIGQISRQTNNETKNYWNTHLSKKLTINKSQRKTHILNTRSSSPCPLQNHVFKHTHFEVTTTMRHYEIVRWNDYNRYCSNHSSDEAIEKITILQIWMVHLTLIEDDEWENNFFVMQDVNIFGIKITNSTCSMTPHCENFVATLSLGLMYFNKLFL
jgi:hypothetical protein